ncbi:MAG: hypothetical protein HYZ33_03365, partial [Ignavibacteriales bacterium]|nr:hypothetical protein [Ignavibacteriales bacterium]
MKRILFVVVLSFVFVLSMFGQGFTFTISGRDGEGQGQSLQFGVNVSATLCEDTQLGERNNYSPPPFPYNFTWGNPRSHGPCDGDDCFSCGRLSYQGNPPLDLRPFINTTQIDTYRVSMYSYLMQSFSWPFLIEWTPNFSSNCDSMKLQYTGNSSETVVVNMFQNSSHLITDGSVQEFYIIKWGARLSASLFINPSILDFGDLGVGLQDTIPVSVTNFDTTTIVIDSLRLLYGFGPFSYTNELQDSGISIGTSRTFHVIFSPSVNGIVIDYLLIYHSGQSSPDTIVMIGSGNSDIVIFVLLSDSLDF